MFTWPDWNVCDPFVPFVVVCHPTIKVVVLVMAILFEDICVYILCSFICSMSSSPLKGRVYAG